MSARRPPAEPVPPLTTAEFGEPGAESVTPPSGRATRTAMVVLTRGFQGGLAILAIGLILAAVEGEPLASEVPAPGGVVDAVVDGSAAGVIDLAILWMIAVPVIATLAIAVAFLRAREWLYMMLTFLVLAILTFSIGLAVA